MKLKEERGQLENASLEFRKPIKMPLNRRDFVFSPNRGYLRITMNIFLELPTSQMCVCIGMYMCICLTVKEENIGKTFF